MSYEESYAYFKASLHGLVHRIENKDDKTKKAANAAFLIEK